MTDRLLFVTAVLIGLTACTIDTVGAPDLAAFNEPDLVQRFEKGPPGARPGSCWGKSVSPAVFETVTEQFLVQPAQVLSDGKVLTPAVYKTETVQRILRERRETWFETPCLDIMTIGFTENLQRALKVRKYYRGSISGNMDAKTRAAIRRYQNEQGLNSGILALETARQLGLVAVPRSQEGQ
ncbi:MAG: peptidoglycan-binding domain-containing protein [Cognatishimia sp.]